MIELIGKVESIAVEIQALEHESPGIGLYRLGAEINETLARLKGRAFERSKENAELRRQLNNHPQTLRSIADRMEELEDKNAELKQDCLDDLRELLSK